jgi:hypothetical protein
MICKEVLIDDLYRFPAWTVFISWEARRPPSVLPLKLLPAIVHPAIKTHFLSNRFVFHQRMRPEVFDCPL